MDKNSVEYKELMRKMDELTKDVFALADNEADVTVIGNDLFSIRKIRGDEAKKMCQEAAEKIKISEASLACKEKLIDLISTYITEVNPTSGGRARRTLIENYANLTLKMMKDDQSALYKVEAMPREVTETTKSNMNVVEETASLLRDAFAGTKVDDAMLRAWVRRL